MKRVIILLLVTAFAAVPATACAEGRKMAKVKPVPVAEETPAPADAPTTDEDGCLVPPENFDPIGVTVGDVATKCGVLISEGAAIKNATCHKEHTLLKLQVQVKDKYSQERIDLWKGAAEQAQKDRDKWHTKYYDDKNSWWSRNKSKFWFGTGVVAGIVLTVVSAVVVEKVGD